MASKIDATKIPNDSSAGKTYKCERFIGKGAFAKCYEIVDVVTKNVFAGQIISKKLIWKYNEKEKMIQEIILHKSRSHPNIGNFHRFFEGHNNTYIILELYKKKSMMELHKGRKTITEYECRYYMYQIGQGVKYLHENPIIHRDLNLDNLFLNDMLQVKINDFGLVIPIEYEGERKKTLYGTPNYIAPEILIEKGDPYEVDVWSNGSIMYSLIVGQAPLWEIYSKFKLCDYRMINDTIQFNFCDHIKIILCPRMNAVTFMDNKKKFRTYRFSTIIEHGCYKELFQKMCYAREKLEKVLKKM
uniref:Uncharacterized protein n=1 Tax=Glossina brevipalpis TaxID=37001 RepID=A0A1A9WBB5_9MUSC